MAFGFASPAMIIVAVASILELSFGSQLIYAMSSLVKLPTNAASVKVMLAGKM